MAQFKISYSYTIKSGAFHEERGATSVIVDALSAKDAYSMQLNELEGIKHFREYSVTDVTPCGVASQKDLDWCSNLLT